MADPGASIVTCCCGTWETHLDDVNGSRKLVRCRTHGRQLVSIQLPSTDEITRNVHTAWDVGAV